MQIIVEIGTDEQKSLINHEFELITPIIKSYEELKNLDNIIIAQDFDKTVNELTSQTDYNSIREEVNHVAYAKVIRNNDNKTNIVFSKLLYTDNKDQIIRFYLIIHELFHIITYDKYQKVIHKNDKLNNLLNFLNIIYDEYYVNRTALSFTNDIITECKIESNLFNNFVHSIPNGHFNNICSKSTHDKILKLNKDVICKNITLEILLKSLYPIIEGLSKDLVYLYSYIDSFQGIIQYSYDFNKIFFINNNSISLIDLFREKYEINDFNMIPSIEIANNYFSNFGIKFEDTNAGLYIHYLRIF